MDGQNYIDRNNNTLKTLAALGVGAGVGILIYEYFRRRQSGLYENTFSPLVDSIVVAKDGVTTGLVTFGWDDDENCSWVRYVTVDSQGTVTDESIIEVELYEDRILTFHGSGEVGDTPIITMYNLDNYGMVDSVTVRYPNGKERRYDSTILGAELKQSVSDDTMTSYEWCDGNIVGVRTSDGSNIRMSYYKNVENHLFPDLNMLYMPFSPDMLMSYATGTRSRNYVSTMEVERADSIEHSSFSYLCDRYDRPVQIVQETTVVREPEKCERSSTVYDIKYLNN